jgi:hypothetical protein
MRIFLFSCIFLNCIAAFAEISPQQAHDFAVRFVEIGRSIGGIEKLNALIINKDGTNRLTNRQIGWWEYASIPSFQNLEDPLKTLKVNRVLIREPDLDNPTQIQLTDEAVAQCLVPPEKTAVIYFTNRQADIRGVLIMALVSSNGTIRLCPMTVAPGKVQPPYPPRNITNAIPFQKNLCTVPGVEIVKIADDNNSYGFPWPTNDEEEAIVFETNPQGCSLRQTILYTVDAGTWATDLNYLPSGRFRIHATLSAGESGPVKKKLLNAIAGTFNLNIKMEDHYTLKGYHVLPPNPLPDCFKPTKEPVGQSGGRGAEYEGYSLKRVISDALHDKPFDLLSTNSEDRFDVKFQVWPEAYGEMAALQQLGFAITQTNLQRKTLVITSR